MGSGDALRSRERAVLTKLPSPRIITPGGNVEPSHTTVPTLGDSLPGLNGRVLTMHWSYAHEDCLRRALAAIKARRRPAYRTISRNSQMEYQRLGNSGLKVSKIILGCMSYGSSQWQDWVLDEEQTLPLLKAAYDAGINTWDTADVYSHGMSEVLVGKAIKKYAIPRKKLVIMTKCYGAVLDDGPMQPFLVPRSDDPNWVNQFGLSRKHIFDAVDASVARLGTYIDVLQIHRLDDGTTPEEIMEALHDVVRSGKVRYIGASSMWAHEFATLQFTATLHGWTKFISMQNFYNLLYREEEREMIPFCNKTGVGLIPWSPIARGILARPWDRSDTTRAASDWSAKQLFGGAADEVITKRVEKVAAGKSVPMASVAIAWVLSKGQAPIVGLSSVKRIQEAVAAIKVKLTAEDVKFLEEEYSPKAALDISFSAPPPPSRA